MSDVSVGSINIGDQWTSFPAGSLGMLKWKPDKNFGTEPVSPLTGYQNETIIVQNTSGGTVTRGIVLKFDASTPAMFQKCSAVAGEGERGDGVVDSYVASTVASNSYFNLVRKGLTRLTSSNSTSIAVGAPLAVTTSGKVIAAPQGCPYIIGYALETVAASNTLFRAYVDFTGAISRMTTGRMVAAGSTLTMTQTLHGDNKIIALDTATGSVVTLPASTGTGIVYKFLVTVTATSNSHVIKVANATDEFRGYVIQDASEATAPNIWWAADDDDTITLNRSTTGLAAQGEAFEIVDAVSGVYFVKGYSQANGTEATPFSNTVS